LQDTSALNTADSSVVELQPHTLKTVTDDSSQHEVSSPNEQLNKAAADTEVPVTTADIAATCNIVPVPAMLLSLPSLMQLSRQALDSRAERLRLSTAGDQTDMFSEVDEQNDTMAEMNQVV